VPTSEGWLYLAVVLDLFTRKIVGWAMRDHMRVELTIAALTMAIQWQKPIHHSDRGSQYAAADYRKLLGGTLKTELVHQACYKTRDAARHDLSIRRN
jgi:putative transposase